MLEQIALSDIASIITCLGVVFGVPYAIAAYNNKIGKELESLKRDIQSLKTEFNTKLQQVKDELGRKNAQTERELEQTVAELHKSNENNRILFKTMKALLDYEITQHGGDNLLLRCREDFDDELIHNATQ